MELDGRRVLITRRVARGSARRSRPRSQPQGLRSRSSRGAKRPIAELAERLGGASYPAGLADRRAGAGSRRQDRGRRRADRRAREQRGPRACRRLRAPERGRGRGDDRRQLRRGRSAHPAGGARHARTRRRAHRQCLLDGGCLRLFRGSPSTRLPRPASLTSPPVCVPTFSGRPIDTTLVELGATTTDMLVGVKSYPPTLAAFDRAYGWHFFVDTPARRVAEATVAAVLKGRRYVRLPTRAALFPVIAELPAGSRRSC